MLVWSKMIYKSSFIELLFTIKLIYNILFFRSDKKRGEPPEPSSMSVKSDRSADFPMNFKAKKDISEKRLGPSIFILNLVLSQIYLLLDVLINFILHLYGFGQKTLCDKTHIWFHLNEKWPICWLSFKL